MQANDNSCAVRAAIMALKKSTKHTKPHLNELQLSTYAACIFYIKSLGEALYVGTSVGSKSKMAHRAYMITVKITHITL